MLTERRKNADDGATPTGDATLTESPPVAGGDCGGGDLGGSTLRIYTRTRSREPGKPGKQKHAPFTRSGEGDTYFFNLLVMVDCRRPLYAFANVGHGAIPSGIQ